jgi:hypothetical protein
MSNAIAQFFRQRKTLSASNVLGLHNEVDIVPQTSNAPPEQSAATRMDSANTMWRVNYRSSSSDSRKASSSKIDLSASAATRYP